MSEESNSSLCCCLRIREWQALDRAPSIISDLPKGTEDIIEIKVSIARGMSVGIRKMDISYILAIPDKRLSDMIVLDIHMEYIRHHGEVRSVDLVDKLHALICAVDIVDLIAVDWLKYHCDTLLLSIVTKRIGHIYEKFLSFILVSCTDGSAHSSDIDKSATCFSSKIDETTEALHKLCPLFLIRIGEHQLSCCEYLTR